MTYPRLGLIEEQAIRPFNFIEILSTTGPRSGAQP